MIKSAIISALDRIKKDRLRSGSFLSQSSPDPDNFSTEKKYQTTFTASNILCAIAGIEEIKRDPLLKKIAVFLTGQKSADWSFNYWQRNSSQNKTTPYPDDLDDSACAWAALSLSGFPGLNGKALSKIINLLSLLETKVGGPYRTWVISANAKGWQDVDLAVNANIAYFLKTQKIALPSLTKLFEKHIDSEDYCSKYYPDVYPVIYFISRAYQGGKQSKIINYLRRKRHQDGSWGNPLNTALAISAMLNCGAEPAALGQAVKKLLGVSGKWPALAFCLDPSIDAKKYFSGSPALTAAFCAEALDKYRKALNLRSRNLDQNRAEIIKTTRQKLLTLPEELKHSCQKALKRIIERPSSQQIIMLPFWFNATLKKSRAAKSLLNKLALANLCGWIAYTIYDDFLDQQAEPQMLPAANYFFAELHRLYAEIAEKKSAIKNLFESTLLLQEQANSWEIQNKRIKIIASKLDFSEFSFNYPPEKLWNKSIGHALGPLSIMLINGHGLRSRDFSSVKNFFQHYLAARQINDDSHDWQQDLKSGQINYTASKLLRFWFNNKGNKSGKKFDLRKDFAALNQLFWQDRIQIAAKDILKHLELANRAISKNQQIKNKELFKEMLQPIKNSALQALKDQKRTKEFLAAYKKSGA